jgi:hypothetical protein
MSARGFTVRRFTVRRVTALAVSVAAVLTAQLWLAPTNPASAAALPGGKRTFVVSMMDGRISALSVRLAVYSFSVDGTVTERYWAWRQDAIRGKGNVRWSKPSSGYTTSGCRFNCPLRTPAGFQKGAKGYAFTGRWSVGADGVLAVRWTAGSTVERWRVDTSQPGIAGLKLVSDDGNRVGWGVGSNAPATAGVSLATVYDSVGWITGPFAENAYGVPTKHASVGFSTADYTLCASGRCLQSRSMGSGDPRSWYHSYYAANPAVDGRKVYWNNQTGVVQQLENPNTSCISASGGGHTNALLQALDDGGNFVGYVGVEASLNQRKVGQDVVAAYAMIRPNLLSAIGA